MQKILNSESNALIPKKKLNRRVKQKALNNDNQILKIPTESINRHINIKTYLMLFFKCKQC